MMNPAAHILEISVLGPLAARRGGIDLTPSAHRERMVLALVALDPHLQTSSHRLVETLWNDDPPPTARNSIQVAVSRLRKQLGATDERPVLATTPSGYLLRADDVDVDAVRFVAAFDSIIRERRGQVATADATDTALAQMQEALGMWRDRHVLLDLQSSVDVLVVARQLERKRLDLVEAFSTALIASDPRSAIDAIEHDAHLEWDRSRLQITYLRALVANGSARDARKWGAHLTALHAADGTPMDAELAAAVELRFDETATA